MTIAINTTTATTVSARSLITSAMKDAGVIGAGQTASSDDMQDAFDSLTGMLALWQIDKLLLPEQVPVIGGIEAELTVAPEYREAIRYSLAERLTTVFQTPLRPDIAALARTARKIIKRSNVVIPKSAMPCHLPMGSVNGVWWECDE